jgi:AcrR family transcriptional regulator
VLTTARELLDEGGYEALSHRAVAQRAAVDPSTVYRRWPSRPALAVDAYLETTAPPSEVPDTGSLRGDLHALVDLAAERLAEPSTRRSFTALVAALQAEPELAQAARERWLDEREFIAVVLRRAAERGEIGTLRAGPDVIELLLAPLVLRAMFGVDPLDRAMREQCVEVALACTRTPL